MNGSNAGLTQGRAATLAYLAAMVMLGTLGVFIHEVGLDTLTTVFFRCVFGALALAVYCIWQGLFARANFVRRNVALAVFSGVLMVLNWVTFFEAIARVGISVATIVFHVQPFLVLLMGASLFREKISADKFAWVGVGFGGLLLACGLDLGGASANSSYAIGIACTLTGALAYSGVTLSTKSMRSMPPQLTALIHCLVGIAALAGFITIPAAGIGARQWGWLAGLGLLPTALAYVLIYGALPKMKTTSIAVLTFIYPAAAVGFDFLVYGHRLGMLQLAGLALIVLAGLGVNLNWRWRRAHLALTSHHNPIPK
jgi:drug/metabolite transporter (DMT)-like permease